MRALKPTWRPGEPDLPLPDEVGWDGIRGLSINGYRTGPHAVVQIRIRAAI